MLLNLYYFLNYEQKSGFGLDWVTEFFIDGLWICFPIKKLFVVMCSTAS